uniref:CSN8/PSMD8/EIF3K domain-containing protein n=1 Tax=Sexangularia sp. CB-2014 TaxID=1486929 RepID=A0A7S1VCT3_9EUKA
MPLPKSPFDEKLKAFRQISATVSSSSGPKSSAGQKAKNAGAALKLAIALDDHTAAMATGKNLAECQLLDRAIVARHCYELLLAFAVRIGADEDVEAAARALAFYTRDGLGLPPSAHAASCAGLVALRLLVNNRLAEFAAEIAGMSDELRASPEVQFVLALEQAVLEGGYEKIRTASVDVPGDATYAPLYRTFTEQLQDTLRDEVADCLGASYKELSTATVKRFLMINDDRTLQTLAMERGWTIAKGFVSFNRPNPRVQIEEATSIQNRAPGLIEQALSIGRELERIV